MARVTKEWVDAYFTYGVDPTNRRVFLFDDVEESTIAVVIKALYFMDHGEHKPIELFVGSFGGSTYEMYGLYDVIQTLKSPVHTVAMGKCMSAAPLLVAAGHVGERWATPNTQFMVHKGHGDFGTDIRIEQTEAFINHARHLDQLWYELMERHTRKPSSFWEDLCNGIGDSYFTAEEAVEYGIVDSIWQEKQ